MSTIPSTYDETALLAMGTATLFEAARLDCDLDPELRPVWPGARLCGAALPVLAADGDNLPLHWALEQAAPGDVLVVDAGGSRCGFWGEVLSVAAQARGVRGLVIDGGVRDTAQLEQLGFAAFSSSIAIRGTRKAWRGTVGEPITVRGRPVRRGDLVVADQDGIVVLPAERVDDIVEAARARVEKEEAYMDRLRSGELTLDIYALRNTR
ncbi:4-hydroxy-4-methyl-2-oxoglutarate aldolase [Actinomadura pelletieri DSM 43383]|uniref:Putative 4-hydroxy-4-methyl-2-oxoglutarate aldolase n=1 Tax=Actinomadura pelletieri DSM 43383 TaxID=1120940 RepID=A0A495QAC4_9ACTN|nr:4-carboxy-4-hydroxy-2-oxoadipate aldolase/oxaloacetate decarboxylase [Actinomadura pelletieri]RKS68264.1 4-hydroxy-4-methyl-2-oxoglutarate aldolase [Actinomadura pelletieri DSM 43383]